jgi:hypothetical protein
MGEHAGPDTADSIADSSAAFLPGSTPVRRLPRHPGRRRPDDFAERFESRALVYDCFRHAGGRVLLVGPPALNLMPAWRLAQFTALPSGTPLTPRFHGSASVMLVELAGVPADADAVALTFAGNRYALPIQPSAAGRFAGRNVLFTMSKDNDLGWIAAWARHHARWHGADAVVFFDNGSSRYAPAEIAGALRSVPGIEEVAVHSWPWRYGAPDPAVLNNPFYTLFLQVSAMSVALRRYAESAAGLMNADIDELVAAPAGQSAFALAAASRSGLVAFPGQYVEPAPAASACPPYVHADFLMRRRQARDRLSRPRKWVLDPRRDWVRALSVHPYMHWIHGRPLFGKARPPGLFYWHFKGISTGWKDDRADPARLDRAGLELDPGWSALVEQGKRT